MLNLDNVRQKTLSSGSCKRACTYPRSIHDGTRRGSKHDPATLVLALEHGSDELALEIVLPRSPPGASKPADGNLLSAHRPTGELSFPVASSSSSGGAEGRRPHAVMGAADWDGGGALGWGRRTGMGVAALAGTGVAEMVLGLGGGGARAGGGGGARAGGGGGARAGGGGARRDGEGGARLALVLVALCGGWLDG
jgi:hypothetical protein